jgi:predicted 3-demethylubiquinone-9 3-methyltransferase (glyoxalase superfamily)
MQKIIPHLWFDTQAVEAAEFYTSVFPDSKITHQSVLHNTPSGDCDVVSFDLAGFSFMAISAGPLFKFNPSISFMLNFDPSRDEHAEANLEKLWHQLAENGQVLMELQEYPFSKKYGWIQDKYGVTWQLILTDPKGEPRPFIIPSLLFGGEQAGHAEAAVDFYLTVFKNAKLGQRQLYGPGQEPNKEGYVMFSDFTLEGQWFTAMDSSLPHSFAFNEAISLLINCENQTEIDFYWEKLSAVPEAEQCGWLADKFGVSWQVSPADLNDMMDKGTPEQVARVTAAFLKMKKFDLAKLSKAYQG